MYGFSIGVMVDSFRVPFAEGIKKAAELGADGVQISCPCDLSAPESVVNKKVKEESSML